MSIRLHCPAVATERLTEAVHRILGDTMLCSMATLGPANQAHINTAFFAWNELLELFFLSAPDAVHCRNLERVPTMALAIFDSRQRWGAHHRGLQLFGEGGRVDTTKLDEAERVYAHRFEAYHEFRARGGAAFGALRFHVFRAGALKLLDEETFGEGRLISAEIERSG